MLLKGTGSRFLPHQFKRLIEALRTHSSAIEEGLKKQERAIRDTAHDANEKMGEIPRSITRTIQGVADEQGKYEKAQRDKEYRQQFVAVVAACWTAFFTALAFWAAAYYALEAHKQLIEMETQTANTSRQLKLYRQEVENTQAAIIEHRAEMNIGTYGILMRVANSGHVISPWVEVSVDEYRGPFPFVKEREKFIRNKKQRFGNFRPAPAFESDPLGNRASFLYIWPMDQKEFDSAFGSYDMRNTLHLRGSITYDNGFGTSISDEICDDLLLFPHAVVNGAEVGPEAALVPCSSVDMVLWQRNQARKNSGNSHK